VESAQRGAGDRLMQAVPPERATSSGAGGGNEYSRRESHAPKNRPCYLAHVPIGIIECDQHCALRQALFTTIRREYLVHGNHAEAVRQITHLLSERLGCRAHK